MPSARRKFGGGKGKAKGGSKRNSPRPTSTTRAAAPGAAESDSGAPSQNKHMEPEPKDDSEAEAAGSSHEDETKSQVSSEAPRAEADDPSNPSSEEEPAVDSKDDSEAQSVGAADRAGENGSTSPRAEASELPEDKPLDEEPAAAPEEREPRDNERDSDDEEEDGDVDVGDDAEDADTGKDAKDVEGVDAGKGSEDEDSGDEDDGDEPDGNEDGADEDDADEDDGDEDEEDEEPVLKYTRIKNRIPELLGKDSATAIDVSPRVMAIGTMNGMVHVLTYEGAKVNSFRPHAANVTALRLDEENDFVATASMEGRVVIHSLTSTESYAFDYKRPMNAVALEPGFSKKSTRTFVCGGMLGNLVLQEKGWLGYREQVLHSGEGPIWAIEWRGNLIAWANDLGVKIYDTTTKQRIGFVDRGSNAPRPELFKCNLLWKDDRTLVIGWANQLKIVRVRNRTRGGQTGLPSLSIEVSAVWEVDCMVAGIAPYQDSGHVVLGYIPPDTYENEATDDRAQQRRKAANPPELRIIDRGDEIAADELVVSGYERYSCSDYKLARSKRADDKDVFLVLTPSDIVSVRQRDEADHIDWLVERERYEEALNAAEALREKHGGVLDVQAIGLKYMKHLVDEGNFEGAAHLAPKVLATDADRWEKWIYSFAQHQRLPAIIPYIPVSNPQLGRAVYEMVLGHLLVENKTALLETVQKWPISVYDSSNVISAVQSELDATNDDPTLLEVLAELHVNRGQPARALPYFLRLRKPNVFDLIRDNNLFDAVQEQALLLVEFDRERIKEDEKVKEGKHGAAIELLVDHTLAIPVERVVQQLEAKPQYLYMYLDALFDKDPQSCQPYSDRMVDLYATYDHSRLMPFLRASNFYDLERALSITEQHDYVRETVFLLGRMGNNLKALRLIIERLGDVKLAIDFAEEQRDDDLWEALITHSETRPEFIRALLEHGGSEIKPVRLIQRIQEGLEIPGLKPALVKVLQASNLQVSLLEGCQRILNGDCSELALQLQAAQTGGAHASSTTVCPVCDQLLFPHTTAPPLVLLYLCGHFVHATCAVLNEDVELPERPENAAVTHLLLTEKPGAAGSRAAQSRALGAKLSYAAMVRVRVGSCPVCKSRKGYSATAPVTASATVAPPASVVAA